MLKDLNFPSRDGRTVRGRLRVPEGTPVGAAVLCHPHPQFGGSMDVWLLATIAERLAGAGWTSLRFDFRPDVGDGRGAVPDLAGALDAVAVQGAPLAVVGWSFGALVGLLHGPDDPRVTAWVGIAPPTAPMPGVSMAAVPAAVATWAAQRSVVIGEFEQFFPDPADTAPHAVHVVAGADHFFFDRDDEVAELVAACLT